MNGEGLQRRAETIRRTGVVTLRDIAEAAGVSAQTVSCVVNNKGSISEPTREKVRSIAEHLGYFPNLSAKAVRTGKSRTLGLVISDIRVPFFPEFAYEVQRVARDRGYVVLIVDTRGSSAEATARLSTLKSMSVEGLITTESMPEVLKLNLPTVMLGVPTRGFDSVSSDETAGGSILAEYLLSMGHRRIGLVNSPRPGHIPIRRQAFVDGLRGRAEIVWELMTPEAENITDAISARTAVGEVTAVVCSHDLIALGLIRALWEMGVSVPNDVSVVGFDDVKWSAMSCPGLTTLRASFADLATRALQVLLDRMQSPGRRARRLKVELTLVRRESVADLTKVDDRADTRV